MIKSTVPPPASQTTMASPSESPVSVKPVVVHNAAASGSFIRVAGRIPALRAACVQILLVSQSMDVCVSDEYPQSLDFRSV